MKENPNFKVTFLICICNKGNPVLVPFFCGKKQKKYPSEQVHLVKKGKIAG